MKNEKDKRLNTYFSLKEFIIIFMVIMAFTGFYMLLSSSILTRQNIEEVDRRLVRNTLTAYLAIMAAGISGVIIYIRRISYGRPMLMLSEAAHKIASGDFSVRLAPLRKGRKKDHLDILFDDFNTMAQELQEFKKQIMDRTGELELAHDEATEARIKAEQATRAKSLFLANMSHEIRTPMNAIIGMTELLLYENLSDKQMQYANDIKNSSASLLDIINDILDLSKIESNKLGLSPVHYNFTEFLDNIDSMFRFVARKKNVEFLLATEGKVPKYLYGDDIRLRQVLVNICGNAIKFTKEFGFVLLKVLHKNESIVFKIEDTGIGIPADALPTIFDAFAQADTGSTRTIKGTGLGLSISKQLVEMMNGRIEVESVYGEGTIFTVTIPKITGDSSMIEHKGKKPKKFFAPSCKILVVDDNDVNLKVASGFLELFAISADTAPSGPQAIEMVRRKQYDIVFMDHMMPGMDGVETVKKIRELDGEYNYLRIIALTANVLSGVKEMFLANGFDDFLSKPLEMTKLAELLLKWLPRDKIETDYTPQETHTRQPFNFMDRIKNISSIDVETGMYYFSNMPDFYQKILRVFCDTLITDCEKMKTLLDEGNLNDFRVFIHGKKASLLSFGITGLSALASELERSAKSGDLQFCQSNFPAFFDQMSDLNDQLSAAFS